MSVDYKWYGKRISNDTRKGIIKALNRSINIVDADIKLSTPVDTGVLRGANTKSVDTLNLTAMETNNIEYAPNIEFGTSRQKAQPFFRIGLIKNIKNITAIFKKEVGFKLGS